MARARKVEAMRRSLPAEARPFAAEFAYALGKYPVNPLLLAALVKQESGYNPQARRHEPDYQRKYVNGHPRWNKARALGWTDEQLATSWGLTQVLGTTAWAMDWHEPPAAILDPATNLTLGAKYLLGQIHRYGGDIKLALIAYNGGHGAVLAYERGAPHRSIRYAEKVLSIMDRYRQEVRGG